jgi:hypothetical protein
MYDLTTADGTDGRRWWWRWLLLPLSRHIDGTASRDRPNGDTSPNVAWTTRVNDRVCVRGFYTTKTLNCGHKIKIVECDWLDSDVKFSIIRRKQQSIVFALCRTNGKPLVANGFGCTARIRTGDGTKRKRLFAWRKSQNKIKLIDLWKRHVCGTTMSARAQMRVNQVRNTAMTNEEKWTGPLDGRQQTKDAAAAAAVGNSGHRLDRDGKVSLWRQSLHRAVSVVHRQGGKRYDAGLVAVPN